MTFSQQVEETGPIPAWLHLWGSLACSLTS